MHITSQDYTHNYSCIVKVETPSCNIHSIYLIIYLW